MEQCFAFASTRVASLPGIFSYLFVFVLNILRYIPIVANSLASCTLARQSRMDDQGKADIISISDSDTLPHQLHSKNSKIGDRSGDGLLKPCVVLSIFFFAANVQ
jgi:hypothetical protein